MGPAGPLGPEDPGAPVCPSCPGLPDGPVVPGFPVGPVPPVIKTPHLTPKTTQSFKAVVTYLLLLIPQTFFYISVGICNIQKKIQKTILELGRDILNDM